MARPMTHGACLPREQAPRLPPTSADVTVSRMVRGRRALARDVLLALVAAVPASAFVVSCRSGGSSAGAESAGAARNRLAAEFNERFADPSGERCQAAPECAWVMPIGATEPECGAPRNAGMAGALDGIAADWERRGCGRRNECDFGNGEARCVGGECVWLSADELDR